MVRQGRTTSGRARPEARRPVSASVYRRRRLVVAGALLVVLAMLLAMLAATGAFSGTGEQASSITGTTPAVDEAAAGEPSHPEVGQSPTAAASPTCDQGLVTVAAATDKTVYAANEEPMLTLQVTNGGTVACEVNMGTSQMEFLVTSGTDRIFSSRDCQAKSEDLMMVIQPGKSESANFPWQRNRSVEGCQPIEAVPGAGGAYYVYVAKLGERTSHKAVFQLE